MGKSVARRSQELKRFLGNSYYNSKKPYSYGGKYKLQDFAKKKKKISTLKTAEWLQTQDPYTLHKSVRKRFPRRSTIVNGGGEQLQADLIDMQKFKKENNGCSFILTVIDVFSKFAWTYGIKNKTGTNVAAALQKVLAGKKIRSLQTDKGKEFYNASVKSTLEKYSINHFSTENDDMKASIVERFNRTIQSRLYRWFTKSKSHRWIDILDNLTESYNNSYHRSIRMKPIDVNQTNSEDVWLNLYGNLQHDHAPSNLEMNDPVRISKFKHVFSKGYDKNWSSEIFFIDKVHQTSPVTYSIRDQMNEKIVGSYYKYELQKVSLPDTFEIEEILKSRKSQGKVQYFVKYRGYPKKFNEWIYQTQIQ